MFTLSTSIKYLLFITYILGIYISIRYVNRWSFLYDFYKKDEDQQIKDDYNTYHDRDRSIRKKRNIYLFNIFLFYHY